MKPSAEVILASAGSGKTFQLTLRYAALVLNGVPLKNILAATFTRKAAGEIQTRVSERLAGAAEGGAAPGDLAEFMTLSCIHLCSCRWSALCNSRCLPYA